VIRSEVAGTNADIPFYQKLGIGLMAGGTAAALCCPVEVSLVRMQADGAAPLDKRRGYKNVVDAMVRIVREEGVAAGWRGVGPTVGRGMVVSMMQLASYDQAKSVYKNVLGMKDGLPLHFSASLTSGFIYSVASLPLDICKTRMQNQSPLKDGTMMYRSIPQTLMMVAKNEGVGALWQGFGPYFARGGGHTVAMFMFVEQYKNLVNNHYGVN